MARENEFQSIVEDIDEKGPSGRRFAFLSIIRAAVAILAGIILLFLPRVGLKIAIVVLGIFLTIDGIGQLVDFFLHPAGSRKLEIIRFIGAYLRLLFGVIITLWNPDTPENFWFSLIFVLAGLNLVVTSFLALWFNHSLRDNPAAFSLMLVRLLLGLCIIIFPMFTALLVLRIFGVILILGSVPFIALGLKSFSS